MYKKILVPHAGTPAGDEALKHAINAAKGSGAKIYIFHVIEDIHSPSTFALAESERDALLSTIREANESIKLEMKKELENKTQECKQANIETEIIVTDGDPALKMLEIVEQKGIDLIVMAKRRKLKGVKKLLSLGSVSRKIVENVTCPVILIDIENL